MINAEKIPPFQWGSRDSYFCIVVFFCNLILSVVTYLSVKVNNSNAFFSCVLVMAYMEIFGNCTQNNNEFLRYSVPAYNSLTHTAAEQLTAATHSFTSSISHSQTMTATLSSTSSLSLSPHKPAIPSPLVTSPNIVHGKPPALPPKSVRQNSLTLHRDVPTPPSSPKPPSLMLSNSISLPQSPVLKISPVRIDADRGGYELLSDASTTSSSVTNNHVNNNQSPLVSPNKVVVTNTNSVKGPTSPTTKVTVSNHDESNDDTEEVVLRRGNPREKV